MASAIPVPGGSCETVSIAAELDAHFEQDESGAKWPRQVDLCGVPVSITCYTEATEAIVQAAKVRRGGLVSCHAVHAIVTFGASPQLRPLINHFDMVTPDGQPVRWGLNLLHGAGLKDRVYGPELTLRVCQAAAEEQIPIYLYGGSPAVIETLQTNLLEQFPDLEIAGAESPPFRPLTEAEDAEVVERINQSGAGILLIGLGCPKQDIFAFEHRKTLLPVQLCVGAAFDFHAGAKPKAPRWMQDRGLEWVFRLCCEPKRLWKRYLVTNSHYVWLIFKQLCNVRQILKNRRTTSALSNNCH
ncbi:WecB/TagA/CpsF family glycosyltransferase [Rubinisphaera margarita]|uniref:WecB/TagA/CpsF family glycosyltransferase n=1 Tax=Rubinisphaera margarita TaxID=2909586 RepID=UPI001EE7EDBA|nr:WecB/TagA/CpsF family glycosyltransferase [Rubinisphaera margarita]MCG6155277.1 WecB/TagA/CpsF family glycosyltransferase [Rubinisphaera margarita]